MSALVQIETALEIFKKGVRPPRADLQRAGQQGVGGVQSRLCGQQGGSVVTGESLRAEYASGPIRITVIEPGYIESEMTARTTKTMLMVDNQTGVAKMVDAIEREGPRHRSGLAVGSVGGHAEGAAAAGSPNPSPDPPVAATMER